jgi:C4-dicarboxylate transporter, DctM subunit
MTPVLAGYLSIVVLVLLIFARMQIGIGMALVGFLGFAFIAGLEPALGLLRMVPYATFASQEMSVIPLFILMGAFAFASGLSEDLYRAAHKMLGQYRGGLAMATVAACSFFAAISGSSLATAATMGRVVMPEMKRYKYDTALATGAIAAGGSIGILIPPSVILIIYGIITEQSIGKLFLAGFIPGIMEALLYILTIMFVTWRNPALGPKGDPTTARQKLFAFMQTWEVILLFLLVIGGIYTGIFTPTEAAGVGAFVAFCMAIRRRKVNWETLTTSLVSTAQTTGMLFIIVFGAMVLGYFFSLSRLPFEMASFVGDLPVNRYIILILILLVTLFLGCIMDSMAIVLLTVPIFYPTIMKLGFDPIWFGILVVRVTEMGLITPPVGMNVYVIQGITGERMGTIFRGVIPFLLADVVHIAILIAIPQITLFLPGLF